MIPHTTLYDDYIDRPKLTEQKNPFEYIVPAPLKWVGTIKIFIFNETETSASLKANDGIDFRKFFVFYLLNLH